MKIPGTLATTAILLVMQAITIVATPMEDIEGGQFRYCLSECEDNNKCPRGFVSNHNHPLLMGVGRVIID